MSPPTEPEVAANGVERWRRVAWSLFLTGLVALVLSSTSYRREGRVPMADEATVLMQAASLAWDFDLRYDRGDHDRELFRWLGQPERLELTWGPGESPRIGFDPPALGALALAPFLRLWPRHGFALANALALALALFVVATHLARRTAGPTVGWRPVLMPLVLLSALALSPVIVAVFRGRLEVLALASLMVATTWVVAAPARRTPRALLGAGLLSVPAVLVSGPLVVVVIWLAWWLFTSNPRGRRRELLLFGVGLALGALVEIGLETTLGAGATVEGRGSYTPSTGFPTIDFETAAEDLRRAALEPAARPTWKQFSVWTLADLLVARSIGILVLFPAVLAVLVAALVARRWSLPLLLLGWALLTGLSRPFDLGGGGVAGGAAFLPTYGALVVLAIAGAPGIAPWDWAPGRRRRVAGLVALLIGVWGAFVAAPIWRQPWRIPDLGPSAHLAPATAWLPVATTQRPQGSRLGSLGGLEVLVVGEGAWIESRADLLQVEEPVELWVLSAEPLDAIALEALDRGPAPRIEGASLAEAGSEVVGWRVDLPRGRHHSVAWTEGPRWVYRCTLDPAEASGAPRAFRLHRMDRTAATVGSG